MQGALQNTKPLIPAAAAPGRTQLALAERGAVAALGSGLSRGSGRQSSGEQSRARWGRGSAFPAPSASTTPARGRERGRTSGRRALFLWPRARLMPWGTFPPQPPPRGRERVPGGVQTRWPRARLSLSRSLAQVSCPPPSPHHDSLRRRLPLLPSAQEGLRLRCQLHHRHRRLPVAGAQLPAHPAGDPGPSGECPGPGPRPLPLPCNAFGNRETESSDLPDLLHAGTDTPAPQLYPTAPC